MSDAPHSSCSQSCTSEQSQPTPSAPSKPQPAPIKPLNHAKSKSMGPPLAPKAAVEDDGFDFLSSVPSPVIPLPKAMGNKDVCTKPDVKRMKVWGASPLDDFMDLIPASQRLVGRLQGGPAGSTAKGKPSAAVVDLSLVDSTSAETQDSDIMDIDGADPERLPNVPKTSDRKAGVLKAQPIASDKSQDVRSGVTRPVTRSAVELPTKPSASPGTSTPTSTMHPMGITIPATAKPQDLVELDARTAVLKIQHAQLWETVTKLRANLKDINDELHKVVLEIEQTAATLG
ncbi:hypothetical protein H4582DRAFT_2063621 [Lactarius indigo]|nr:hypothetical protein H4582DRAFT_2063621 [Lactarius indigo]